MAHRHLDGRGFALSRARRGTKWRRREVRSVLLVSLSPFLVDGHRMDRDLASCCAEEFDRSCLRICISASCMQVEW